MANIVMPCRTGLSTNIVHSHCFNPKQRVLDLLFSANCFKVCTYGAASLSSHLVVGIVVQFVCLIVDDPDFVAPWFLFGPLS